MQALHIQSPGQVQYTILQDGILIRPAENQAESKLEKIRRLSQSVQCVSFSEGNADSQISQQRDELTK